MKVFTFKLSILRKIPYYAQAHLQRPQVLPLKTTTIQKNKNKTFSQTSLKQYH